MYKIFLKVGLSGEPMDTGAGPLMCLEDARMYARGLADGINGACSIEQRGRYVIDVQYIHGDYTETVYSAVGITGGKL